ncbi:MAG: hypothetical protein AB1778_02265 [Candidatus Bipolaricaulota bacterium]
MKLGELARDLGWETVVEGRGLDRDVSGGFVGDLLSHVLAGARPGEVWITIQHHANVVGVAQVADLAGVVLAHAVDVPDSVVAKAREAGVTVLRTGETSFVVCGKLYERGVGRRTC